MTRKTRIRAAVVTALVTAATVSAGVSRAGGSEPRHEPSKKQIAALFDRWNAALRTGDPEKVAGLYAKDAVLLPTVSNRIRTDHPARLVAARADRSRTA